MGLCIAKFGRGAKSSAYVNLSWISLDRDLISPQVKEHTLYVLSIIAKCLNFPN